MLIDLLAAAADEVPDRAAVVTPDNELTYASALARARLLAAGLERRGVRRFACVVGATDLVPLLCASTLTGAEACIYPATASADEMAGLAARFDHKVVVSDRDASIDGVDVVMIDALAEGGPALAGAGADAAPVLILTSGTTGGVKGARHDWRRLAAAVSSGSSAAEARWLLTYNLNQFAGIQMLLHVLVNKGTLVVPASNQPRSALEAMRALGVTHASATPTFWRFLAALIDGQDGPDIALEQITLGGEAVPAKLLADLHRLFPRAKVSQVYASTEAGSTVSVRDDLNGLPLRVLERSDDAAAQMKIVDGQLYMRSKVGMLGYYDAPDVADGEWLPTGDLVEVRDDRIYFVGRATETINVGGVKVHPLPVEELAAAVDGVQMVRVYGRPNPLSGQIVAVDVVAAPGFDTDDIDAAIRDACANLPPAAQPRRIRFVDTIEVRANKIIRGADS